MNNSIIEKDDKFKSKIKNEKRKKMLVLGIVLIVVSIVMLPIIINVVDNTNQYNQATALKDAGKNDDAYEILSNLGNFKDAKNICNDIDYEKALLYLDKGRPKVAFYALSNIEEHKETEIKIAELLKEYPYLSILKASPGEEIELGKYEQDNNISNGAENIEWIVLKNENGVLYAVSKYVLDAQVYNTHNGDGSTLKGWLKDDFYDIAFGEMPNGFINKVGLLTRDDMQIYERLANAKPEWTAYAMAQGPEKHYYAGYSWWLDGKYFHGYGDADVLMSVVIESGSYSANSSDITSVNGVRPMIIIDCNSTDIDYYAEDYDDIKNAGVTTRTESDITHITGSSNSSSSNCPTCNGTGYVRYYAGLYDEGTVGRCPMCN